MCQYFIFPKFFKQFCFFSNKQDDNLNLIFIDFGLSQFSQKPEDKAVDLYVLERAIKSAHIGMELLLNKALQAYKEGEKDAENVLLRLEEVRMRGRKRDILLLLMVFFNLQYSGRKICRLGFIRQQKIGQRFPGIL
uniref:non-specific serine/threonine protein kinase n=1 Tax=Meloidogyne incognita TaxID=6306 RepID=A0A914KNG5_MELIC